VATIGASMLIGVLLAVLAIGLIAFECWANR
jgi:hypothetical protein